MKRTLVQKWLLAYQRGVATWLDFVIACIDEAAEAGAQKVVESLPNDVLTQLRSERVIIDPPPPTGPFPVVIVAYYLPGYDFESIDRRRCLGAKLLHDYFVEPN